MVERRVEKQKREKEKVVKNELFGYMSIVVKHMKRVFLKCQCVYNTCQKHRTLQIVINLPQRRSGKGKKASLARMSKKRAFP